MTWAHKWFKIQRPWIFIIIIIVVISRDDISIECGILTNTHTCMHVFNKLSDISEVVDLRAKIWKDSSAPFVLWTEDENGACSFSL
jgi:hypothetical protein